MPSMNKNLEIILNFRKYLLIKIDTLHAEQLNYIPASFNNNIIWNLGHLNAVLQGLCYKNSGLPIKLEEKYFYPFLAGTKPVDFISENEIISIKKHLITSVEQLQTDLEKNLFKQYHKSEKIEQVYNIQLTSINDAIYYITHHEGIHFNAILTLQRMIEIHE